MWNLLRQTPTCSRTRPVGRVLRVFLLLLGIAVPLAALAWPPDESKGPVDYANPSSWPSDPGYGGQWQSWSFAPAEYKKLDARTRRLGMGGHYDRAWAKTPGDPRVIIAVLDSGAYWDNRDLVNKWFLNRAELPPPEDACQKPENRGEGKRLHDANGDGVFNVQDYTTAKGHEQPDFSKRCDARIQDGNRNGLLDPQDLIASFSDGQDDDRNGYVDDIAGWDFFRNDNDAYDDTRYGHGNGEAEDSGAEADNGLSDAGVCPKCRLMPLRVGDSFVADGNDFAVAVTYAVDIGAAVVQEALGTLDHSLLARFAIDYAYDNHVTVIASAADENSFHHNFPGTNIHTVYVHAIRYNADQKQDATHAFAFDNCTNYGAQLQLSVPGTHCSSEATGRASGMAGLLYSAALLANLPAPEKLHPVGGVTAPAGDSGPLADRVRRLTAEEVRQIMIGTTDSFYDPQESHNPAAYPSGPGFVRRFGYGRVNARTAVDAILAGALPPQVEIESPDWFEVLHQRLGSVPIVGRIALRNGGTGAGQDQYDYVLEWAKGVDPKDGEWTRLGSAEHQTGALEGILGQLPVANLEVRNPVLSQDDPDWQPDDVSHVFALTVRVTVVQHSTDPARNGLKGEARRTVHLDKDADLLPGFPKRLAASGEASLKMADLNGDGKRELIVGDSSGQVHAFLVDGKELAGWPYVLPPIPALAQDKEGHLPSPAFSAASFRKRPVFGQAVLATPAVGDVNGDGKPDVVVASYDGTVVAIGADGKPLAGFPVNVDGVARSQGTHPKKIIDDGFFAAPVLVDLDGDKRLDIVGASFDGQVYVWKGDGNRLPGWPQLVSDPQRPDDPKDPEPRQRARILSTPAVGDLNGDGIPDLVLATNEQYGEYGRVYALDGRGGKAPKLFLPGWPVALNNKELLPVVGIGIPNAPAMGDIDRDGVPEIFVNGIASRLTILRADGSLYKVTLNHNRQAFGENSRTREFSTLSFIASPALGDLDGDGAFEAILPTTGANTALSMAQAYRRLDYEMHLSAWDLATGKMKPGFPQAIEDYLFFMNPLVVDIDGDGKKDVVSGSAGYFVHAWNVDGQEARGFPKLAGGWIAATPTVGDMDGDGKLELAAITRNGVLFVWHVRGLAKGRMDWDSFHHDLRNTGNLATPLDQGGDEVVPPETPEIKAEEAGCSCLLAPSSASPSLAAFLGLVLLLSVRRLRKNRRRHYSNTLLA